MKITDIKTNIYPSLINGTLEKPSQNLPSKEEGLNLDALKKIYGEKTLKKIGVIDCKTCAERTYVDGSDDPGVSFKTPGKIAPEVSASVVLSHELEHVSNEQAKAQAEDREVVSQSVTLHASICPECGKSYIAGGVTKTVTQNKKEYGLPDDFLKGVHLNQEV